MKTPELRKKLVIFEWGKIQKRGDIGSTLNISLDVDPLLTKSELTFNILLQFKAVPNLNEIDLV